MMRFWLVLAAISAGWFASSPVAAQACYESSIRSPTPFMGNHDEVFRLLDGTIWQVQSEYEYLYAYYPSVVVCPARGMMVVDGKQLSVRQITGAASPTTAGDVIESRIEGEFTGWEGETIFRLANGQIWQQSRYAYKYRYAYSPDVLILRINGRFIMQVEGMDDTVQVTRIR